MTRPEDPPEWVRDGASGFESQYPASVAQVGAREWELRESPMWYWDAVLRTLFEVPVGQRTDWGSVWRLWWWFIDPMLATAATLLHDYLWRVRASAGALSYRNADRIFREALRSLGVDPVMAWSMWAAVRLGALTRGPAGRAGWWRTAPGVVAIAVPMAAVLAIPTVVLLLFDALISGVRWVSRQLTR